MARAGVFGMVAPPTTTGDGPVEVAVMLEVIETCATASGSAGWCAMIGSTSAVSGAYLPPAAAAEIFADPDDRRRRGLRPHRAPHAGSTAGSG